MVIVGFSLFIVGVAWITLNSFFMPKLKCGPHTLPKVSICVPLRNEEARVAGLVANLKELQYPSLEVLLYDDLSENRTRERAVLAIDEDARFHLIEGGAFDEGWKGKPHACFRLANAASGKFLLFIDADIKLDVQTIDACVATMERTKCDALSGIPQFIATSFLGKLLTPLLHFFVYMHLPIYLANSQKTPKASAASGAFLCMKRTSYMESGGHELVKDAIEEDVTLFFELKSRGYQAMLFHVADYVHCSIDDNSSTNWTRFSNNVFAGFGNSYLVGTGVLIIYMAYYVSPAIMALYSLLVFKPIYILPYICITLQRAVSDFNARQLNLFTLFMPLSAVCYCTMLLWAMWKRLLKREKVWKRRTV